MRTMKIAKISVRPYSTTFYRPITPLAFFCVYETITIQWISHSTFDWLRDKRQQSRQAACLCLRTVVTLLAWYHKSHHFRHSLNFIECLLFLHKELQDLWHWCPYFCIKWYIYSVFMYNYSIIMNTLCYLFALIVPYLYGMPNCTTLWGKRLQSCSLARTITIIL
jgi:hypothetical protein